MWLVMYGKGRALRSAGNGGSVSSVKSFKDRTEADAFIKKCKRTGLRTAGPLKVGA
jgi:hypothetical protein